MAETDSPPQIQGSHWAHQLKTGFGVGDERRNLGLDSVRGLVALMICLFHMCQMGIDVAPQSWYQAGTLRVNIFFTLSGLLVTLSVLRPAVFDARRYVYNRSIRILPTYYIALGVCLALVDAAALINRDGWTVLWDLFLHVTLLHGLFSEFTFSFMGPYWTISHEWLFYILLLVMAVPMRGRYWWVVTTGMILTGVLARAGNFHGWWHLGGLHPLCVWDQFAMGMIAAKWLNAPKGWQLRVLGGVGAVIVAWGIYRTMSLAMSIDEVEYPMKKFAARFNQLLGNRKSMAIYFGAIFAAGVAACLLCIVRNPQAMRFLRFTPLPFMGTISYSTYLYHMPVLLCLGRSARNLPEGVMFQDPWFRFGFALVFVYGFSALAFWFFERPFLGMKMSGAARKDGA